MILANNSDDSSGDSYSFTNAANKSSKTYIFKQASQTNSDLSPYASSLGNSPFFQCKIMSYTRALIVYDDR